MKTFLKYFANPLLIAVIASILYVVDALLGGVFVSGASFMWVAFVSWTIFFSAKLTDRIRAIIGIVIGFLASILMNLITSSFNLNLSTISISCLLGVFVVNFLVMFFDKTEKVWMNSITGIFTGIFLTFSGLGVKLNPLASVSEGFLMLGIILTYSLLGLLCGFVSTVVGGKIKNKLNLLENKDENIESNKAENK